MRFFKKRRENDVFTGGEEPPPIPTRRWSTSVRIILVAALLVITIVDWYLISHLLQNNSALWYWIYSVLFTIHLGWILMALAVLRP